MELHVSISKENKKMGANIPSVSLPPFSSCRKGVGCMSIRKGCTKKWNCYALNMYYNPLLTIKGHDISTIGEAWEKNWTILVNEPEKYWREVESTIMMSRYFRFHVGGDFVDANYFAHVVDIAKRQTHCSILAFTKKFDLVNNYIEENGELPSNIKIIFSGWKDLEMENPYNLPECHVLYKDGSTTAKEGNVYFCTGSCEFCAKENCGCWSLNKGEHVLIKQH